MIKNKYTFWTIFISILVGIIFMFLSIFLDMSYFMTYVIAQFVSLWTIWSHQIVKKMSMSDKTNAKWILSSKTLIVTTLQASVIPLLIYFNSLYSGFGMMNKTNINGWPFNITSFVAILAFEVTVYSIFIALNTHYGVNNANS